MFITFEGVDGSGKTTHAKRLFEYLVTKGYDVVLTREPGGSTMAERIRALVLSPESAMRPETEALLFAAARAEHVRETVMPALERGAVVISDRYIDSSIAFQVYGRGLDEEAVRAVNALAMDGLVPDRTYLMTVDAQSASSRLLRREPDRIEGESDAFRERVEAGFLRLAERFPERIVVVPCVGNKDEVAARIRSDALELLRARG